MRKFIYVAIAAVTISLTSCFDVFETITINEDGSGVYEQKIDMGRAFEMINEMGGGAASKKKEKMDSTFSFKELSDTSKNLTESEKKILAKGKGIIKLDVEKGLGQIAFNFPYANAQEFVTLQNLMHRSDGTAGSISSIAGSILKGAAGKSAEAMGGAEETKGGGLPVKDLEYSLTANHIACKVLPAKKEVKKDDELKDLPQNMKDMMKMKMNLIINLPRPLKTIDNKVAKISTDKKKIEIKKEIAFEDNLSSPDFNFNIDF